MSNITEKSDKYFMPNYQRLPVCLVRGENATAYDETGKRYIDFGAGIGVNSLGYCDGEWVKAIAEQAAEIQHVSNYYYSLPGAELAEKLCLETGYKKVLLQNSGAEANECAFKLARKYSFDKHGGDSGRNVILSLSNSFHGRTLATLTATGQEAFHNYFFPFPGGFIYTAPNDTAEFRQTLADNPGICAVVLEFIQGEGGVLPLDADYVETVFALCREKDILIIADEVQTGVGRTGKFLSAEHYGVQPDIVTLAKGLGGGLPIGAVLAAENCCDVLSSGTHGTTFGGNPVVCAGASYVLDKIFSDGFLAGVSEKGRIIKAKLDSLEENGIVSDVFVRGLMIGFVPLKKTAAAVKDTAAENGLLVLTAKDRVRLLPPLTISDAELSSGLDILTGVLL
ncbi:acetylornithine aminotransferase [Clostridia bacterium]|nr:acetylornithine aminotransferase [Clostridia bacterium]